MKTEFSDKELLRILYVINKKPNSRIKNFITYGQFYEFGLKYLKNDIMRLIPGASNSLGEWYTTGHVKFASFWEGVLLMMNELKSNLDCITDSITFVLVFVKVILILAGLLLDCSRG